MKNKLLVTLVSILVLTVCSVWAQPIDYEKIIQDACKKSETSPISMESWRIGMMRDYMLVLDHLEFNYQKSNQADTTDGKCLVCGRLMMTGFGKTEDGMKKRITQEKLLCHLFNGQAIQKVTTIFEGKQIVLNGWDDWILI